MAKKTEEVVDNTGAFTTVAYLYAVVSGKKYPIQVTIETDNLEKSDRLVGGFFQDIAESNPEEDMLIFEPREVSGSYNTGVAKKPQVKQDPNAPNCPHHGKPITTKQNRKTGQLFTACSERNADGSWCNWSPSNG